MALDVVLRFVVAIPEPRTEILSQHPGAPTNLGELMRQVGTGDALRRYQVASGAYYSVHGIGVRMHTTEGIQVDVDLDNLSREQFDPWRIRIFAESARLGCFSLPDLQAAQDELVLRGVLTAVPDRSIYRVAD